MGQFKTIEKYSQRSLNVVAAYLAGRDVQVVVSPRVKFPLVVALNSATLVLNPELAGLYDLFLGAKLLNRRQEVRCQQLRRQQVRRANEEGAPERRISGKRARQWTETARHELELALPGVRRLTGWHQADSGRKPPKIVWSKVPWNPLDLDSFTGGVGQELVSGIALETFGSDYGTFLAALQQGRCPLRQVEGLPMPVADMPLTISTSESPGAEFERLEAMMAEQEDVQQSLMRCYQRKSEGLRNDDWAPRRSFTGTHLDSTRLALAAASARGGHTPRVFRQRRVEYQRIFDPSQHLVLCGFDAHSFSGGLLQRAHNARMPAMVGNVFRRLGVDLAMQAFCDRVVTLADGRQVYLHSPVVIKSFEDGFEPAYYNRLANFVFGRLRESGAEEGLPAAFPPLQLESLRAVSRQVSKNHEHPVTALIYLNSIGMDYAGPEHSMEPTSRRAADLVDKLLNEMVDIDFAERKLDFDFMYVPEGFRAAASPNGHVAKMHSL